MRACGRPLGLPNAPGEFLPFGTIGVRGISVVGRAPLRDPTWAEQIFEDGFDEPDLYYVASLKMLN
ncbi:hypothetical protein GCM10009579_74180 [Streptomyces javensis]|uniref:Uncharacterized protein n=1 Tax=Streptomyces javensis TaxID=114698 RepID=A0ABN1XAT7_9ACTN